MGRMSREALGLQLCSCWFLLVGCSFNRSPVPTQYEGTCLYVCTSYLPNVTVKQCSTNRAARNIPRPRLEEVLWI
jgi:hypothetical protein